MDRDQVKLAKRMEAHESAVWARCVEAVAAMAGNPLEAVIDRSGPVPVGALCALDRADLNRVIALGAGAPTRDRDLDAVCSFYVRHDQRNFCIEVTPVSRPQGLTGRIAARGLVRESTGSFKMWRPTHRPPAVAPPVNVRRLSTADTDALAAISVSAWGAWNTPVSMAAWFVATLGQGGVRHYGVFDGERLVATGALFLGDGLGWLGFDATHPRYQGRRLRQAISSVRMADAAAEGC
ncbi:MAG TPA: hypothetical protein VMF60_03235, partial [Acidimicrobiales bacterium]|nr:hypothetical protein [Acidimicrobiales bacterium]